MTSKHKTTVAPPADENLSQFDLAASISVPTDLLIQSSLNMTYSKASIQDLPFKQITDSSSLNCQKCCNWKKWAQRIELQLLNTENQLLAKEAKLSAVLAQLKEKLSISEELAETRLSQFKAAESKVQSLEGEVKLLKSILEHKLLNFSGPSEGISRNLDDIKQLLQSSFQSTDLAKRVPKLVSSYQSKQNIQIKGRISNDASKEQFQGSSSELEMQNGLKYASKISLNQNMATCDGYFQESNRNFKRNSATDGLASIKNCETQASTGGFTVKKKRHDSETFLAPTNKKPTRSSLARSTVGYTEDGAASTYCGKIDFGTDEDLEQNAESKMSTGSSASSDERLKFITSTMQSYNASLVKYSQKTQLLVSRV